MLPPRCLAAGLVPTLLLLVLAVTGPRYLATCNTLPEDAERVRAEDSRVLSRGRVWTTNDGSSYVAAADRVLSDAYLARRSPYVFRIGVPLLVGALAQAGIPVCLGFLLVSVAGLSLAALGVRQVARAYGVGSVDASLAAAVFLTTPKALNALLSVCVDSGAWAFTIWFWWAWQRRRRYAGPLLALGILCHEWSVLVVACVAVDALRDPGRRRDAGVVLVAAVLALSLPRFLIDPSTALPPRLLLDWTLARLADLGTGAGLLSHAGEYLLGVGVSIFWLRDAGAPVLRPLRPLLALVPVSMLAAFPLETGRLLVPAAVSSCIASSVLVQTLPEATRRVFRFLWPIFSLASGMAWLFSLRASWVTAVGAGLLVVALQARRAGPSHQGGARKAGGGHASPGAGASAAG